VTVRLVADVPDYESAGTLSATDGLRVNVPIPLPTAALNAVVGLACAPRVTLTGAPYAIELTGSLPATLVSVTPVMLRTSAASVFPSAFVRRPPAIWIFQPWPTPVASFTVI